MPAPGSASSAAKPLSATELAAELQPKPTPAPKPEPAPEAAAKPKPVIPEAKEQGPSPERPDFRAGLRDKLAPKPDDATPPEKKEAVEKKPAPVTKDDAAPVVPPKEDTPVPEEHKRVLPHDKPDTAKRIKALLADREAAQKERDAAKAELDAAKKAPATPPEELKRLKDEYDAAQADLMRYRRLHDIENDKDFAAKYREPVKQVETSIAEALKRNGLPDGVLEVIKKEGGFAAFSRSGRTFNVNEPDPDNPEQKRLVPRTAAELARSWLSSINVADSEFIRTAVGKQQLLADEERAAIQAAQAEAKDYFSKQTEAQKQQQAAADAARQQTLKEYQDWLKSAEEGTEWLKDKPVPDNATPEQKQAIERANEFNKQLRDRLRKDPTNAKEYGELKLEAAEAHHLRRTLGDKDAEIAALKEQLARAKGAMRTTPKGGSLLKGDPTPPGNPKELGKNESPMDALKNRLRGQIVGRSADE